MKCQNINNFVRRYLQLIKGSKLSRYVIFGLFGCLAVLISVCATSPSPNMKTIGWIPHGIAKWADANPTFRNFPVFAALSFFAVLAFGTQKGPGLSAAAFAGASIVALFGTGLEIMQTFLPDRFFDPNDIAWTVTGALAGAMVAHPVLLIMSRLGRHE